MKSPVIVKRTSLFTGTPIIKSHICKRVYHTEYSGLKTCTYLITIKDVLSLSSSGVKPIFTLVFERLFKSTEIVSGDGTTPNFD